MTALLLALLLLPDDRKNVDAACPLDGHKFVAIEIVTTNEWGGVDRDFCRHAYKTRPMEFYVWVCPKCGFAGKKKDFGSALADEAKGKLRAGLKPAVTLRPGMKQTDIPGWAKYDLLAQVRTILGAPPEEAGKAYLSAAWCWREEGALFLEDFDEFERLWNSYGLHKTPMELGKKNRADFELEVARKVQRELVAEHHKGLNFILASYLAAYLFRRHGENGDAKRWLDELAKRTGENSVVDDAAAKMRASMEREQEYQKRAIPGLDQAFAAGTLEKKALGELAYVLGETQRRLGERARAAEWYAKAIEVSPDEALRKLATEQKALVEK
ncbi:MAG: DUF2225 domain-containing protein [Planctomycetes bacterium]|nr:DUF2225 domain-containing protein [Planctomycetota bacterium]